MNLLQRLGVSKKDEPAKPPRKFGVPLRKGVEHVVDGERVFYAYTGVPDEPDDVLHELPLGKHVVNGVLTWVRRASGIRIGVEDLELYR